MARREFLSPAQRAQLLALPATERELVRFYSLSPSELAWIRKRRGEHNRLGDCCYYRTEASHWINLFDMDRKYGAFIDVETASTYLSNFRKQGEQYDSTKKAT